LLEKRVGMHRRLNGDFTRSGFGDRPLRKEHSDGEDPCMRADARAFKGPSVSLKLYITGTSIGFSRAGGLSVRPCAMSR
jgi:hypothetical protein